MARIEATLYVSSVEETRRWYEEVLGWSGDYDVFDEQGRCLFGMVYTRASGYDSEQGDVGFNLARRDKVLTETNKSFEFLVYVDDVDHLYSRILDCGWNVNSTPENQPWGGRTFKVSDLNGFTLTFAQMIEFPDLKEIQKRINRAGSS